jgi:hypothetical protein
MTSKDMFNLLERQDNEQILIMVQMCVRYLVLNRKLKLKEIIKDIKKINKLI